MSRPSEGHLGGHAVEPLAVLGRKLTQVVAVSGDDRVDEAVPLGLGQRREIGSCRCSRGIRRLLGRRRSWPRVSFGVGSIMPFLPWQMSWQARLQRRLRLASRRGSEIRKTGRTNQSREVPGGRRRRGRGGFGAWIEPVAGDFKIAARWTDRDFAGARRRSACAIGLIHAERNRADRAHACATSRRPSGAHSPDARCRPIRCRMARPQL